MPSSTSSSRAPQGAWGRTWLLAALLTVMLVGGAELWLRGIGFTPSFNDNADLWSYHRARATGSEPLVLLGFSRVLVGIDPEVLSERLDRPVVQLGINASNPMPVLADLAADSSFSGSVWLTLVPHDLFLSYGLSQEYVAHYHATPPTLNRQLNRTARAWLVERLAIRSPQTRLLAWYEALVMRAPNRPPQFTLRRDRWRRSDYSRLDEEGRRFLIQRSSDFLEPWRQIPLDRETYLDSLSVMEARIDAIRERGGDVTLIRLPVSGEQRSMEAELFPRERFWDVMADFSSAPSLHYADVPALGAFPLPDGSHLDYHDSAPFTLALVDALGL